MNEGETMSPFFMNNLRRNMFKQYFDSKESKNPAFWEEIPDEELWEDGEIDEEQLSNKLYHRIIEVGDWVILRRKDG